MTRPAPITAAAVLLIVVAGMLLLFALAAMIYLAATDHRPPSDLERNLICPVVVGPIPAACLFMIGYNALRARSRDIRPMAALATLIGFAGALSFLIVLVRELLTYFVFNQDCYWYRDNLELLVAMGAPAASVSAMVLVAGLLLGCHRTNYAKWRRELCERRKSEAAS